MASTRVWETESSVPDGWLVRCTNDVSIIFEIGTSCHNFA